jgi:rubrerythrin
LVLVSSSLLAGTCDSGCGYCSYYLSAALPAGMALSDPLDDCAKAGCPAAFGGLALAGCSHGSTSCSPGYPGCTPSPDVCTYEGSDDPPLNGCGDLGGGWSGCVAGGCNGGRRYAGLTAYAPREVPGAEGRWLAELAYLEAASVEAFRVLATELRVLGAPDRLVRRARAAARDEARHARQIARLARRFGARGRFSPRGQAIARGRVRPLEEVAVENAVEGCVREAFGALVALWQAEHASDAGVREVFGRVARDEARHAALAFAINRWAESLLSARARGRVARAMGEASSALVGGRAPMVGDRLGLPSSAEQRWAIEGLHAALWA